MILRQDVSFFDKEMSTTEVAGRMSRDIILIQDAMGEKVASFTGEKQAIDKILTGAMSVGQASPCLSSFAAEQAAAFKIFETIKRKPEIDAYNISGLKLDDIRGDIELRDVYFSYPTRPDEQIFTGFSLSIPSGMTVALVGEWEWEVNSDQSNREKRVEEG